MEADAGIQLIIHNDILRKVGLQVKVIIGAEDSSMIAAVRRVSPNITVHKLADKHYLSKNFSNELYKIRETYSQLSQKGAIAHIKKYFVYAVLLNKGNR